MSDLARTAESVSWAHLDSCDAALTLACILPLVPEIGGVYWQPKRKSPLTTLIAPPRPARASSGKHTFFTSSLENQRLLSTIAHPAEEFVRGPCFQPKLITQKSGEKSQDVYLESQEQRSPVPWRRSTSAFTVEAICNSRYGAQRVSGLKTIAFISITFSALPAARAISTTTSRRSHAMSHGMLSYYCNGHKTSVKALYGPLKAPG